MINNEIELLEYLKNCLNENNFELGIKAVEKYSDLITKKYYDIAKIKLELLIKSNKLIEALVMIKEELSLPYIPLDFEKFIKIKQQEISYILKDNNRKVLNIEDLENIDKLDNDSLFNLLPKLKDFNLNPFVKEFQNIFLNEKISDLTKSLLIACLSDVKLNYNFYVIKEKVTIKFNPSDVFDIRESVNLLYIEKQLKTLEKLDINVLEIIKRLIMTYLLNIYPLVISEDDCNILLMASCELASDMVGRPVGSLKIDQIVTFEPHKVQKMKEKLNILIESI